MPTSIEQLFQAASLNLGNRFSWGVKPNTGNPGVYVISLTDSISDISGAINRAPLSRPVFEQWLRICPDLTLDGMRPSVDSLMDRIAGFWLPDEVILYIGKATSLKTRVGQYFRTPIGAKKPHSGGYFLKLLSILPDLWVHYIETDDPVGVENKMLEVFTRNVSDESRNILIDPAHPFPFANLEWPRGTRKNHGIKGARVSVRTKKSKEIQTYSEENSMIDSRYNSGSNLYPTQRVTAADIRGGRIRIPSTKTSSTKMLFPDSKSRIQLILRGQLIHCSWNPRMGPDRQRSGVLQIGRTLRELVTENETLHVFEEDGQLILS